MSQHFCDVFVAYYIIAISNFHKKTPSIALYDILLEKSHGKLRGSYTQVNNDPIISIYLW